MWNNRGECGGESFKEMDKNGDGVISKKEFLAFHEALFRKMDANKDGKLTPEEMEVAHEAPMDKCDVQF